MRKEIFRQTMFKYLLMRIRIKIGYHAFQNRMTISELIIAQIYRSYVELTKSGTIPPIVPYSKNMIMSFNQLIENPELSCFKGLMDLNKSPIMKRRQQELYRQKIFLKYDVKRYEELP